MNALPPSGDDIYKKIIVLCVVIIIILAGVSYYESQKPAKEIIFDAKPYQDTISLHKALYKQKQDDVDSLLKVNGVLSKKSKEIIIRYNDKFKFLKGATASELDSLLKLSW